MLNSRTTCSWDLQYFWNYKMGKAYCATSYWTPPSLFLIMGSGAREKSFYLSISIPIGDYSKTTHVNLRRWKFQKLHVNRRKQKKARSYVLPAQTPITYSINACESNPRKTTCESWKLEILNQILIRNYRCILLQIQLTLSEGNHRMQTDTLVDITQLGRGVSARVGVSYHMCATCDSFLPRSVDFVFLILSYWFRD